MLTKSQRIQIVDAELRRAAMRERAGLDTIGPSLAARIVSALDNGERTQGEAA